MIENRTNVCHTEGSAHMVVINVFLWTILALVALLAAKAVKDYQAAEKEHARLMRSLYREFMDAKEMKGQTNGLTRWACSTPAKTWTVHYDDAPVRFFELTDISPENAKSTVDFFLPRRAAVVPVHEIEGSSSRGYCA
jgi:hypothetical protein